ncbi:hypothetical protein K439DRAFT_1639540 [Ramaria rubella]|nr:hypothetical protein K439DRAFT_1639540 [Ramaria rubella]
MFLGRAYALSHRNPLVLITLSILGVAILFLYVGDADKGYCALTPLGVETVDWLETATSIVAILFDTVVFGTICSHTYRILHSRSSPSRWSLFRLLVIQGMIRYGYRDKFV